MNKDGQFLSVNKVVPPFHKYPNFLGYLEVS